MNNPLSNAPVSDNTQFSDHLKVLGLEQGSAQHETSNGSGTALVAGHSRHASADLNVSTSGIVSDALAVNSSLNYCLRIKKLAVKNLAGEQKSLLHFVSFRLVLQTNHNRTVTRN